MVWYKGVAIGAKGMAGCSVYFTDGIYWEAGSFLRTPFTEGCDGVNYQTLPPGRRICCTFSTTSFSSVQLSSANTRFLSLVPWKQTAQGSVALENSQSVVL